MLACYVCVVVLCLFELPAASPMMHCKIEKQLLCEKAFFNSELCTIALVFPLSCVLPAIDLLHFFIVLMLHHLTILLESSKCIIREQT
jgi:hypothetical protein